LGAFFTAYVKRAQFGHVQSRLQQQGAFANAGIAAQQDQRAGHHATAQHAVKLAVAEAGTWATFGGNILNGHGPLFGLA
jgi:hypothetical protein